MKQKLDRSEYNSLSGTPVTSWSLTYTTLPSAIGSCASGNNFVQTDRSVHMYVYVTSECGRLVKRCTERYMDVFDIEYQSSFCTICRINTVS